MKYVTGIAAAFFSLAGVLSLLGGIGDKGPSLIGIGAGLLVSGIILGAICDGLSSLEGIREDLRTAARGIQKDLRQAETTPR